MSWVLVQMKESNLLSPSQQPYFLAPPQPILDGSGGFNLDSKVSPSVMLIIIILSIVFFISGLLHLLVRFLLRPPTRDADDLESVTALQGQLQQLFHLHDAGVDQAFIDTLPVFEYKTIIGLKNPFDCAVCLSEFDDEDELRLLPKCSHAFHMECIDRWLLSHSTCPICRASLLPDFSPRNPTCSPIVLVLESGSESSREIGNDRDFSQIGRSNSVLTTNSHLGLQDPSEFGSIRFDASRKSCEMLPEMEDDSVPATPVEGREKVIAVKLGKYRNVDSIGDGSSNKSVDARRCYSMGSFEYVLDENTQLQVPIRTPMKKQSSKKPSLPLTPGHRSAMSLCDCESRRDFASLAGIKNIEKYGSGSVADTNGNAIGRSRRDSFSISKIWARGKKGKQSTEDGSRRAFSFRFPANKSSIVEDDSKTKNEDCGARRTNSEMGIGRWWENAGSELEYDEKNQSFNSLNTEPAAAAAAATPSFARRTLLWLAGRQNKVVHSSFTPNNV